MSEITPACNSRDAAEEQAGPSSEDLLLEAFSPVGEDDIANPSLATALETAHTLPAAVEDGLLHAAAGGADTAVAWYRARLGSTAYEGWCEKAARTAWGCPPKYPSAIVHWKRSGPKHTTGTPPKGAFVFWNISAFGHIGIADGDGGFYATSVNGRIGHATSVHYYRNYLGWIPGGCA
ncbi:CHAP domain-containing protein [Streptomyces sp. NPDC101175]|uniref:CHAP domain-containing protein n=1 Tax=Streptomyces sp. NPDC101175 TaxID=3366123 RepID=UPI003835457E